MALIRTFAGAIVYLALETSTCGANADLIDPVLAEHVVCRYDFEHPVAGAPNLEADCGLSGTAIGLINGGSAQRAKGGAFPTSTHSLATRQINPSNPGNDDWKAGTFSAHGAASLIGFARAREITLMGWVKRTSEQPALNSNTPAPHDRYNALGLFGLLSGESDGHDVRALIEILAIDSKLRLVALGRRLDDGRSKVLVAQGDWRELLPRDTWVFLAATFDYDSGEMALYRDGRPLPAFYSSQSDDWALSGGDEPDLSSETPPCGIKIGGSFPQNTREKNPFDGAFDELVFLDRKLTSTEIEKQYGRYLEGIPTEVVSRIQKSTTFSPEYLKE